MENPTFNDYKIADISNKYQTELSNLEKSLSTESNNNIVLIAYEPKYKDKD